MPDLDTFDLDAAFRGLEHDIAGITSPQGASGAVVAARRRRRTRIGAVVAAAVVVAGALTLGPGLGHDRAVGPSDRRPAPLDGASLTAATRGWTPPWTADSRHAHQQVAFWFGGDCTAGITGGRAAFAFLGNAHGDTAFAELGDFGGAAGPEQQAWHQLTGQVADCSQATLLGSFVGGSGSESEVFGIAASGSETAPEYLWLATTGRAVGELKIFGQAGALPSANGSLVADALLAALADPASYPSPARTAPVGDIGTLDTISDRAFTAATSGWRSGWREGDEVHNKGVPLPCGDRWRAGSTTAQEAALGANGYQAVVAFASTETAQAAINGLTRQLGSCVSGASSLSSVVLPDGTTLMVATRARARRTLDVWYLQRQGLVSYLVAPGGTLPPQRVSLEIGRLMDAALSP
ncbi:MAG TPA: hypothetical protein VHW64_06855 [Nocardioides sp.]|jgi:hypothetical protein|uniref:hypothetical protein n=1 Tax=Nocardioides sp. TaxID=35761 RepID=UPI002E2F551E|nr:hypothetical protein [Nocardioides sp.]HEX3930406.1 hypothetical protein [Nocardioides sp.]